MSFKKSIKQLAAYVNVTEMAILIWGPGGEGGEHYEKREKIRQAIKNTFPQADVHFSEDPELKKITPGADELTVPEQELWHLGACDVCIVLDTSKGAGEEVAHFVASRFAYKLLILTSDRYKDATSFPAALRQGKNQIFYSEEEYRSCSLTSRAMSRVKITALGKYAGLRA